jgi:phospholipid/cholesterol/gamma-HCH transport system substrate-binding protein
MENRAYALITGVFVLAVAAAIVVWAQWLGGERAVRTPYRVVSTTPVSGLNVQGNVRYRGISVGRVMQIRLDPADKRRILIDIEVDEVVPVTRETYAQLGQEGITGIAYVHLLEEMKDAKPEPAAASADGVVEIPLRPSFLDNMADNAEATLRDARTLIANVNALLVPENRQRIGRMLASLERSSANLEELSQRLPGMVARTDARLQAWLGEENRRLARDSLARLNESAKALPGLAEESRKLIEDARALVAQANRLAGEAQGAAGELRGAAASVQRDTLPRVNELAESVERGARRIGRLAETLEREPSSVLFGRPAGRPGPGEPGFQ